MSEAEHEFALLQRTKALFDNFPTSRHPQKMCKEFLTKEERPKMEADPELDKFLDADPELKTFLRHNSFWLPARTKFVAESLERHEQPDVQLIGCTSCKNGHLCIEPDFFKNVL